MPFDATIPLDHSLGSAAEMRAQFTSLKALIDALTATVTSQGATIGAQAATISSLQSAVDGVGQQASDIQSQLADYVQHTELDAQIIAQSASNVDGTPPLNGSVNDPPTQEDVSAIADR